MTNSLPGPGSSVAFGPARVDALGTTYRPFRTFSPDGLVLAGRDHGDPASPRLPLVCLPGLTRNVRDFEPIAARFSAERRVVSLEFRGRGESQYDPDWKNYNPLVETRDVLATLDALGLGRIAALGTSRGGIVTMFASTLRPGLVGAAILNDVGPRIELAGLLRIKGYIGAKRFGPAWLGGALAAVGLGGVLTPGRALPSWDAAVALLRLGAAAQFPDADRATVERAARRIFREVNGRPVPDYDPALARTLDGLAPGIALPELWPQFEGLLPAPVLVLRGELSDILSRETVEAMTARHPGLESFEVPRQGHAPLLEDAPTQDAIATLLLRAEG